MKDIDEEIRKSFEAAMESLPDNEAVLARWLMKDEMVKPGGGLESLMAELRADLNEIDEHYPLVVNPDFEPDSQAQMLCARLAALMEHESVQPATVALALRAALVGMERRRVPVLRQRLVSTVQLLIGELIYLSSPVGVGEGE
ncbi:MAG: hypothetical protein QM758_06135 [Armatimonas sp.]